MSSKYLYPYQRGPLRPINVPQFHTKMYHLKTKITENCSSFTYATYRDCYWDWSNAVDHGWTEILLLWPKNLYRKGVGHIWQLPRWLGFIKEAMVKIWVGGGPNFMLWGKSVKLYKTVLEKWNPRTAQDWGPNRMLKHICLIKNLERNIELSFGLYPEGENKNIKW